MTYTTNLELCLSAIPLWQRLLTPCDRGIEIDYNTLFCDLATQPYVGLNGYKGNWIYLSISPLHTGKDPVPSHALFKSYKSSKWQGSEDFFRGIYMQEKDGTACSAHLECIAICAVEIQLFQIAQNFTNVSHLTSQTTYPRSRA